MRAPLSVIVPTLNSSDDLSKLSASLFEGVKSGLVRELIVSDCGSSDGTTELAGRLGAEIVISKRGRGSQLAAGAGVAGGDWLLFLHADTVLSDGWVDVAERHMQNDSGNAAYFKLRFSAGGLSAAWFAGWANLRSVAFGLPYGDQGLLIPRKLYDSIGGYREIELFEDVEMARALKGKLKMLRSRAISDPRRYLEEGWLVRGACNLMILTKYFIGVPPDQLARSYYRQRQSSSAKRPPTGIQ